MEPISAEDSEFLKEIKANVPRLAPLWHDFTVQELVRSKGFNRYARDNLPDFGGFGIEVAVEENILKCKEIKHVTDSSNYAADTCSLPFLPANKVADLEDPCLKALIKAKGKFINFCSRLELSRRNFKNKRKGVFRNEVLSTYKNLKNMSLRNKFEKILLHKQLVELAVELPETTQIPPINLSYAGGCLTSQKADRNLVILHPTGESLKQLGLTVVEEAYVSDKYFQPVSSNEIKLKGGQILQIDSSIDGYCYVRQKQSCHFVDFCDLENISKYRCIKKENLVHLSSSPYNPSQYITIYEKGILELNDIEISKSIWNLYKDAYSYSYAEINSLQCSFGSHPQSILCLNEKCLLSFDMRLKQNQCSTIFSTQFPTCYYNEHLVSLKSCAVDFFQHIIASNHHLFICDERYPKRPVLSYNHMLNGYPLYCDAATVRRERDTSDIIAVLGTQNKKTELSAFSIQAQHALVQPISLAPPFHLSSPTDCAESLKLHCIPVEDTLVERLSQPLIGISVLLHTQNTGLTVFQLNSFGDLFFQDFKKTLDPYIERGHRVHTGCVLTLPDKIQMHLSHFIPDVEEDYSDLIHPFSTSLNVDLSEIFNTLKNLSDSCDICSCDKKEITFTNLERDQAVPCSTCGLSGIQSTNLNTAFNDLTLLSGASEALSEFEEFDVHKFYEFTDPFSKKILDVWNDQDNDPQSDFSENESNCSISLSTFDTSTPNFACSSPASSVATVNSERSSFSGIESNRDIFKKLLDDFIPPSQEIRPLVGETLRKSKRLKSSLNKSGGSSAGF